MNLDMVNHRDMLNASTMHSDQFEVCWSVLSTASGGISFKVQLNLFSLKNCYQGLLYKSIAMNKTQKQF